MKLAMKKLENLASSTKRNLGTANHRSNSIEVPPNKYVNSEFSRLSSQGGGSNNTSAKNLVSISQIRQSRQKVEQDVMRLHNRIQLLEAEEERANKIIQETKNKVKKILKSRPTTNDDISKNNCHRDQVNEMKQKQPLERKRMTEKLSHMTPKNKVDKFITELTTPNIKIAQQNTHYQKTSISPFRVKTSCEKSNNSSLADLNRHHKTQQECLESSLMKNYNNNSAIGWPLHETSTMFTNTAKAHQLSSVKVN